MDSDNDIYNNETPIVHQYDDNDNDNDEPQQIPQKKKTQRVPRIQVNKGNHITKTKTDPKITLIRASFKFEKRDQEGNTSYTDDEDKDEDKKKKKTKKKTKKKYQIDLNRFAMIAKNCMYLPNQKFKSAECRLGETKSHVQVFANGTIKIIAPSHEEIEVCLEKAKKYIKKSENIQLIQRGQKSVGQIICNAKLPYKVNLPLNMKTIRLGNVKYKIYKSGCISLYGKSEDEIQRTFEKLCRELCYIARKD